MAKQAKVRNMFVYTGAFECLNTFKVLCWYCKAAQYHFKQTETPSIKFSVRFRKAATATVYLAHCESATRIST